MSKVICNGTKKSGKPCTFKAFEGGKCKFHLRKPNDKKKEVIDESKHDEPKQDGKTNDDEWEYEEVWVYEDDDGKEDLDDGYMYKGKDGKWR